MKQCRYCHAPARKDRTLCAKHAAYHSNKVKQRRIRLKNEQRCVQCGKASEKTRRGFAYCKACCDKARMYKKNKGPFPCRCGCNSNVDHPLHYATKDCRPADCKFCGEEMSTLSKSKCLGVCAACDRRRYRNGVCGKCGVPLYRSKPHVCND